MNILIINGPNLNLLGKREPEIYGYETLEDINKMIATEASKLDVNIDFFQSNHEGAIIDRIHEAMGISDAIIINPGAYTHYSYAIRDAISSVNIRTIEVHLSDIHSREEFRKVSVIKDVCVNQISGLGSKGYINALNDLANSLKE